MVKHHKEARSMKKNYSFRYGKTARYITGYAFLLPFLILFLLFIIIPVIWGIVISFTKYDLMTPMQWVGLENYIALFTVDDLFLVALKNTLTFALIAGQLVFGPLSFLRG